MTISDQVEQQGAARRAEGKVAQLVQDDEVQAQQPLGKLAGFVQGLFLLKRVDQIDRGEEPNLFAMVLDRLHAQSRRDVGFARSRRTSVILPSVRRLRFGSRIRSTLAGARWSPLSAPSVMPAPTTSSFVNPTGPSRFCRSG